MMTEEAGPISVDRTGRRTSSRVTALIVLAAIGGALIAVLAMAVFGRDEDKPGAKALPSAAPALTGAAAELASLVARGHDGTYHASYRVAGNDTRGSVEIEVWRKGKLVRQEERITSESRSVVTAAYQLEDRTVLCTRTDEGGGWQCGPGAAVASDGTDPVLGAIVSQLGGVDVRETERERIGGREARCFSLRESKTAAGSEICLTDRGIPLLLRTGDAKLELVEFNTTVGDEDLKPPAGGEGSRR